MSKNGDYMTFALQYAQHIINPCIDPATGISRRDFYIREAKKILPTLPPPVREFLDGIIREFEGGKLVFKK